MNIYLDLETIPSQDQALKQRFINEVTAPAQYKKQESIDEWLRENRALVGESEWRKTSFDGAYGSICVAGVAVGELDPVAFYSEDYANDERKVIADLFAYLEDHYDPSRMTRPVFVGHNLVGFDLRFLFQRAVVNGIRPPSFIPFQAKPWDSTVFDTMTAWAGHGSRVKLDKLCEVFGIQGKGSEIGEEIDGSKVWDFVKAGRIADVATYCKGDVSRTREVYKKLTFSEV